MTATVAQAPQADPGSLLPDLCRVVDRRVEAGDVVTLSLEPVEGSGFRFRAGQFNMLTAFGVGEVAISVSSAPGAPGPIEHTIRDVGAVTHALCRADTGDVVGVRGPFGTDWEPEALANEDVVVVAGGIGLAPLRGAVREMMGSASTAAPSPGSSSSAPAQPRRLIVLVGARMPDQIVFGEDLERWRHGGAEVNVTVDVADRSWPGPVGVVTTLLASERLDPARTTALICGPEIMMRFTARALIDKGVGPEKIRVSLERNMQCGIGLCGHCQLGPLLLCRDGPIVTYAGVVGQLMSQHER